MSIACLPITIKSHNRHCCLFFIGYILNLSLFLYILIYCSHLPSQGLSINLSLPILSERNAVVAIIKAGLTAASESGGQKGNKTSEIRGQPPGAKVNSNTQGKCDLINAAKYMNYKPFKNHFDAHDQINKSQIAPKLCFCMICESNN